METELEIKTVVQQLLPLLIKYDNGKINYQIQKLRDINEIIDSDMSSSEKKEMLRNMSENIYPPQGGLTDFYVWDNDSSKRIEIKQSISALNNKLWNLIK
ncbi:hypothetical protein ACYSNR_15900 [Enterococcus sp. LJL128]